MAVVDSVTTLSNLHERFKSILFAGKMWQDLDQSWRVFTCHGTDHSKYVFECTSQAGADRTDQTDRSIYDRSYVSRLFTPPFV